MRYTISNKSSDVLKISIHGVIGLGDIDVTKIIRDLDNYPDVPVIKLSMHSPGGSVYDGLALYNAFINHPAKVFGRVEGEASSAGSFILMACDVIEMPENSFMMIHNAHGGAFGDSKYLRGMAELMDKLQDSIINIYAKRTGLSVEKIIEMMDNETHMNAVEAVELGFADIIVDPTKEKMKITDVNNIKDFQNVLRDAGMNRKEADALISRAKAIFQVNTDEPEDSFDLLIEALNKVKLPDKINVNN